MQKPAYKKKLKEIDELILAEKNNLAKASSQIIANAHNFLSKSQPGADSSNAYMTPNKNTGMQNTAMTTTAQGSSNQGLSSALSNSNIRPGISPQLHQSQSPQQTQPLSQSKPQQAQPSQSKEQQELQQKQL